MLEKKMKAFVHVVGPKKDCTVEENPEFVLTMFVQKFLCFCKYFLASLSATTVQVVTV